MIATLAHDYIDNLLIALWLTSGDPPMQELNLGFYPKVRFATALEEADSNRQFVADSTLEESGFELSVR